MADGVFPLEKIFGSRTRVKVIALFTVGVRRPYYVREIARHVNERLNAVRRELEILHRLGFLETYMNKRRKYYTGNQNFILYQELASIMQKAGPLLEDALFKNIERLGELKYVAISGRFTGATEAPTDLLLVGIIDERRLSVFVGNLEKQLGQEITYTPMTTEEYTYRRNFNDLFLRQFFTAPHKELINVLSEEPQATVFTSKRSQVPIRSL